jgi:formamidopyrimidine-DNA glycosylase
MPELPEVETVRCGLAPVMEGQIIARADIRRPDLRWPFPPRMAERLTGARVLRLRRRSKYILADLSTDETLLVHLGMSGRMLISAPGPGLGTGAGAPGAFHFTHPTPEKHDHVVFELASGARVTFNDARRFGAMDLMATAAAGAHPLLAALGPEPLGNLFHADYLAAKLTGRTLPIKSALLDQRIIAGLGNIYVCEVLHRTGIAPQTRAGALTPAQVAGITDAVRVVLTEAIAAGGSSLRDYRQTDGELGYFQHAFRAYGRAGEPCPTPGCTGTITRIAQSGRSSFYCPICQR